MFVQLTHREIQSLAQLDRTLTALPVSHLFQYFGVKRRHREYVPPFQSLRCFNSLFQNNFHIGVGYFISYLRFFMVKNCDYCVDILTFDIGKEFV